MMLLPIAARARYGGRIDSMSTDINFFGKLIRQSGIYQITHSPTGRCYIGSAKDFYVRWQIHRSDLRNNKHHARHLQRAWGKYGEVEFQFDILLFCLPDQLLEWEQLCIDYLSPLFNTCRVAGSSLGMKVSEDTKEKLRKINTGKKMSPEAVAKTAAANKGRVKSPETIAKMCKAQKGKIISEAAKQKISAAVTEQWQFEDYKNKVKAAHKQNWESGAYSAKLAKSIETKKTPEYRAKVSETSKKKWQDPAYREKLVIAQNKRWTPEARASMSRKQKELSTDEVRRKISERNKGQVAWNKGKTASPELKAKLSQSHMGQKRSPESRLKQSETIRARKLEQSCECTNYIEGLA